MRVTIAMGAFFPVPALRGGAIEKKWFVMAQDMASRGHQVTQVSRLFGDLPATEEIKGVRHIRVAGYDVPPRMVQLKLRDLRYTLRVLRVLPPSDILVTNTFWLPLLIRHRRKGRLYVHIARYPKGQMRYYGHADRLQAVSSAIARAVEEDLPAGAPARKRVRTVNNPLPYDASEIGAGSDAREAGRILYVGRVHPEKGIKLLLESFDLLLKTDPSLRERARLDIVGPWATHSGGGGDAYQAELRDAFAHLGERILWTGPVFNGPDLLARYRSADAFVYPSLAEKGEAFGIAPLEAMAFGAPPVVSGLQCFRDFVEDGANGIVFDHRAPNPAETLANTLRGFLTGSQAQRDAMREQGAETARRFTVQRIVSRYLEDFDEVLSYA